MNTLQGFAILFFFPLDLILGTLLLLFASNTRVTQNYVYGEWRDAVSR